MSKWFSHQEIKAIKKFEYTSKYFIKAKKLLANQPYNKATLQFICFSKTPVILAGINEVIDLIKSCIPKKQLQQIEIWAQKEGTKITIDQPILKIVGDYRNFCFLENIIDGILSQRSTIATNVNKILESLKPHQKFIYMADRINSFQNQAKDGYSAYVGGCRLFTTPSQVQYINDESVHLVGTIPHALIQQYENNLVQLIKDYNAVFAEKPIILIDFENDVIKTLNQIKPYLHLCSGVRIDTSTNLVDKSLETNFPNAKGVCLELLQLVNQWLKKENISLDVYISSNLDAAKIKAFNDANLPIAGFGVGSALLENRISITADLVAKNDKKIAKIGRKELNDANLIKIL